MNFVSFCNTRSTNETKLVRKPKHVSHAIQETQAKVNCSLYWNPSNTKLYCSLQWVYTVSLCLPPWLRSDFYSFVFSWLYPASHQDSWLLGFPGTIIDFIFPWFPGDFKLLAKLPIFHHDSKMFVILQVSPMTLLCFHDSPVFTMTPTCFQDIPASLMTPTCFHDSPVFTMTQTCFQDIPASLMTPTGFHDSPVSQLLQCDFKTLRYSPWLLRVFMTPWFHNDSSVI